MGNWSSTSKASPASTVDASAFNEEKAPGPTTKTAAVAANQQSLPAAISTPVIDQPKPKVNVSNNGGMRSLNALEAPLK